MNQLYFYFFLFTSILLSCNNKNNDIPLIIKALDTIEKRNQFLEEIRRSDQKVRNDRINLEETFGYNSQQVKEAYDKMKKIDNENIHLISAYLDKYGYPTKPEYSNEAISSPYLVIHHSSTNKYRKKYFPLLYRAHKKGDFSGLAFFLGRMHHIEFGHFMSFKNPYTEEFEIDELTKALGLTDIMKKIDAEL